MLVHRHVDRAFGKSTLIRHASKVVDSLHTVKPMPEFVAYRMSLTAAYVVRTLIVSLASRVSTLSQYARTRSANLQFH